MFVRSEFIEMVGEGFSAPGKRSMEELSPVATIAPCASARRKKAGLIM